MFKTIKAQDLKVGMHVVLPVSWIKHPFLKNQFTIESPIQIQKIIDSGFEEIAIDTEKGLDVGAVESARQRDTTPKWEQEKLVPDELREAIKDKTLSVEKKTRVVYKSSLQIMARLLEDPKAEAIHEAKQGIAEIADFIISDDATTDYLLKITTHDYYTFTHSVNVGVLSILLSKTLFKGSDAHNMHELAAGFFLHDIGKVRIDPAIINKSGKLSDEEMKKMRAHPYQGYKILSEAEQLTEECKVIVMQHHERDSGTGYPRRLKGEEIHAYGRICCIADVYDALTAKRSYRKKQNPFSALKIMKEEMLDHFHKDIFEKFVMLFG